MVQAPGSWELRRENTCHTEQEEEARTFFWIIFFKFFSSGSSKEGDKNKMALQSSAYSV